jgi:Fis family transcriptional regulator
MSASAVEEMGGPQTITELRVNAENRGEPLRDCVRDALDNYFRQLEGHTPGNLYQMVIAEVERPLLETVLHYAGGNQTRAAAMLGLNRGTLRKKLKIYQLE